MIKVLLASALLVAGPMMANETTTTEPTTTETTDTSTKTDEAVDSKEDTTKTDTTTTTETTTNNGDKVVDEVKKWLGQWLEPQAVATIASWLTYLISFITCFMKLIALKKQNNLTVENVSKELNETLGDKVDEAVKKQMEAYIPALINAVDNQKEVLNVFSKIMALSQENTPESRVAILNLISTLGVVDTETTKKAIEEEQKAIETKEAENKETLESIINEK